MTGVQQLLSSSGVQRVLSGAFQVLAAIQTGAASFTFSAMAIGTASSERIVVAVVWTHDVASFNPTAVTIGGISATKAIGVAVAFDYEVQLWSAIVPTGTTADVVVTCSGTVDRCKVGTYAIYGAASGTVVDTASATASSTAVSATVTATQAGNFTIGAVITANTASDFIWSVLTEDQDTTLVIGIDLGAASAANLAIGNITPQVADASVDIGLIVAIWE